MDSIISQNKETIKEIIEYIPIKITSDSCKILYGSKSSSSYWYFPKLNLINGKSYLIAIAEHGGRASYALFSANGPASVNTSYVVCGNTVDGAPEVLNATYRSQRIEFCVEYSAGKVRIDNMGGIVF